MAGLQVSIKVQQRAKELRKRFALETRLGAEESGSRTKP